MKKLEFTLISNFRTESGKLIESLPLSYQIIGPELGSAPLVLINHALTGNSDVEGWWSELIGPGKTIATDRFTVIAFNIPGNGFDENPDHLFGNYRIFTGRDIASAFWKGLENLGVDKVFAIIGGSLGGGIAWEMSALKPRSVTHLIPIATDWKATDWVLANVLIQDRILNNSDNPVRDARLHAMTLYRTPLSLLNRFNRKKTDDNFQVENWLIGHGEKLKNRFRLASYKLVNHLLKTIDITRNRGSFLDVASTISAHIHLIAVDSDLFYIPEENIDTLEILLPHKSDVYYHEIESIHGHDAFLIESGQLSRILSPIFSQATQPV